MNRAAAVLGAAFVGVAGLVALAMLKPPDAPGVAAPEVVVASTDAGPVVVATTVPPFDPVPPVDATPVVDPDCTLSMRLELGSDGPEVACLEAQLLAAGVLEGVVPDERFDEATASAVEAYQRDNGLVVDGVVGPQTAEQLGSWVGPDVLPADPSTCAAEGRSAVVDRFNQRAWLCEDGIIVDEMPMTSAISQPDPGTYEVYAKDLDASSTLSGEYSTMTHFVAFTYGKYQGARIAFHSVPKYPNGEFIQSLDSVGSKAMHGESSGCIRVLPDDAELIWDWLAVGDPVIVVS